MRCEIVKKKKLSPNAIEITLCPKGDFRFIAGQHVKIKVPRVKDDPIGEIRSFSIASAPNQKNIIIILRIHEHMYAFKRYFVDATLGSEVEISKPFGSFILPDTTDKKIIFIAGGIGITPFLSMIYWTHGNKISHDIHLLYFNKNEDDEVYKVELRTLADSENSFKLSEFYGPLQNDILKVTLPRYKNTVYYIAGPPGMVTHAMRSLAILGVSANHIKTEEFKGYK
jgi:glycine betaine catabolism B